MLGTQAATQFPQDGIPETGPDALVPVFVKILQSGGGGFLEDVAARSCRADEVPSAAAPPSGFVQRVRIESSGHFSHLVSAAFLRTRFLWQSRRRPERDDHAEPAARVLATVIMLDHVRGDEGLQSERTKVVA
jgi:hypothetical protein